MIWEPYPWKVDLYKRAQWLKAKQAQRRWPESACLRVEQCVMIGCYCVRKLIEAGKLTDVVLKQKVPVIRYRAREKNVHSMNWHCLDDLYDLTSGSAVNKPLKFICNQLIHSFVYVNGFGENGGLDFVMFSSDFERNRNLFQISIDELVRTFVDVAQDEVVEAQYVWNEAKKDYDRTRA